MITVILVIHLLIAAGLAQMHYLGESEWNAPLILAQQMYAVDKFRYFHKRAEFINTTFFTGGSGARVDTTSLSKLLAAPFTPTVVAKPFVIVFMLLGIADGILGYELGEGTIKDVDRVLPFRTNLNRAEGTLYFETAAAALSYGAAVSEELIFRGLCQPYFDNRFGQFGGLLINSAIFTSLHVFNRNIERPAYFLSQAFIASLVLGRKAQKEQYELRQGIAAVS